MAELLENYYSFYRGSFAAFHALLAAGAMLLLALQHRERLKLKGAMDGGYREIVEAQYTKALAPIEKYDRYFDLCTTFIILTGLIGTMIGFVAAIPHLSSANYDFADLKQALSTSAFGIAWAVAVMILVHVYRWTAIDRLALELRERQTEDSSQTLLTQAIAQGWSEVSRDLNSTLERLQGAVKDLADSASATAESTQHSIAEMSLLRNSAAQTAANVQVMLQAAGSVPETVKSVLEEVARAHAATLDATAGRFNQSLGRLESVPERFRSEFETFFDERRRDLEAALNQYRGELSSMTREMLASVHQSQASASESLARTVSTFNGSISALSGLPEELRAAIQKSFEGQLGALEKVSEAQRRAIAQLQADSLSAFSESRKAVVEALDKVTELPAALDAKLGQFAESQRGLAEALGEIQRKQLAELFHNGVSAMKQLEARAGGLVEAYQQELRAEHEKLTAELRRALPDLVAGLLKEMQTAAGRMTEHAGKIDEGFDAVFADAKKRVQDAVVTSLAAVTEIIEGFRQGLRDTQEELPASVRAAQEEVIRQTVHCAEVVARCGEELSRTAEELPRTFTELRPHIQALNHAVRNISNAAADFAGIKPIFDRSFQPFVQEIRLEVDRALHPPEPPAEDGETGLFGRVWSRVRKPKTKSAGVPR
jgi:methyl-accepting chemotaxis protein